MIQLDLFAEPAAPRVQPEPDPLAVKLVNAGLVPNAFLLGLGWLSRVTPGDPPSRLFRFPLDYEPGEPGRLVLRHPLLADHPFVKEVERAIGEPIIWEPLDEFGRDRGATCRWWHAVDLVIAGEWQTLLRTIQYTDRDCVLGAVAYGLDYGHLTLSSAGVMLSAVGSEEPDEPAYRGMRSVKDGKAYRPQFPFHRATRDSAAWARFQALKDGLVKPRGGFLWLTPKGLNFVQSEEAKV